RLDAHPRAAGRRPARIEPRDQPACAVDAGRTARRPPGQRLWLRGRARRHRRVSAPSARQPDHRMTLAEVRSQLFVPADHEDHLAAAFASGTDAVVADLEDFVASDRKDAARANVAALLPGLAGAARFVRVNAPDTGQLASDLEAIRGIAL